MKIKKIELTIDKTTFVIERSHPCATPGLNVRAENGTYDVVLVNSDEDELWTVAHEMFRIGTGHRCTGGDVRGLQMMLSLSLP